VRKKWLVFAFIALALVVPLAWSPAGAQISTGGMTGKIVDEKGDPLPGVLITARNRDTGIERAVTTDSKGEYSLLGLPPATYIVQATFTGYGAPLKTIVVNIGQKVPLNFELKPGGGLKEEMKVTAEPPLVNTTKSEISTVVTETQIRSYPLLNRDFNDLAQLAPGVKLSPGGQFDPTKKEILYTPFTTGGSDGRNVNISVDGGDNNDNVVGFFVQGFTAEAIQEFEVVQDQYKPEYGRSLGGVVNVITKSGTNDFGGSVFGYGFDDRLRTRTYAEKLAGTSKSASDRGWWGFSVGGPIMKDKLFYFIAAEKQKGDQPLALNPILTNFSGTEPAGFPFSIAGPGTTVPQSFDRTLWDARFDYQISKNHLFYIRYASDISKFSNDQGDALTNPDNQGSSNNHIWSTLANWQWNIRGNMINELKVFRNDFENGVTSASPDPVLTLAFDQFSLGRNANTPQATFQNKFQVRDDFSWIVGRHSFKTGLEGIRIDLDDSFLGPPATPSIQFTFNAGVVPSQTMVTGDNNGNGVDDGIELIADVTPTNPGLIPGTHYFQYGAYFQDDWEVSDRWRFNYGARVDRDQDVFKDATTGINKAFYECFAHPSNDARCGNRDPNAPAPLGFNGFNNTFPKDPTNISPRVGFVYRVNGEDKDVLRGSWGLYYDKLIDNLVIFMRQNLSPFFSPALPVLAGCDTTSDPNCANTQLTAGTVVDARLAPLPADFTLANWQNSGSGLRPWFNTLTTLLGPATFNDAVFMPTPDWKTPYTSAYSVGWGHVFTPRLSIDSNLIYRAGFHQLTRQSYRGRNSGRESPFPFDNTGGGYTGISDFFTTDGKTQYIALQESIKGRWPNFDFGVNVTLSQALGTQDNGGTGPTDGGPVDIFEGGNIRFTGGQIDSEWGKISGDQFLYAFLYGIYRLPMQFQVAGQISYGTKTAYQGFAGVDLNQDGFNSQNEYAGTRGSGLGDDFFDVTLRGSKDFATGAGTKLQVYADVFNAMNRVNHGLFVIHQQLTTSGGSIVRNPQYGKPTGDTLTRPRTVQLGLRFTF